MNKRKKRILTVQMYLENRSPVAYSKNIRIIDNVSKRYLGGCADYLDRQVLDVKITSKYLFIFI